ncbi:MAG: c-type cytochrome [Verrucomicrobia bacterium]|nr:c-type cytochrome [Verrucomicrobiota bacterium]
MKTEVNALIAALLISVTVIGGLLGAARIVQSNTLKFPIRSAAESIASQNPKAAVGAKLFALNCARCHVGDVTGNANPTLNEITERETDQRIKFAILNGIKGEMPAFGKKLDENDAATLVVFIRSLPDKRRNLK